MRKSSFYISIFSVLFAAILNFAFTPTEVSAQQIFLAKTDSIAAGDTVNTITPGGLYEKGAFTVRCDVIADTLKPQIQYGNSNQWTTVSIKNIRTQASDTIIRIQASTYPLDFEINDPCIKGFRLVSTAVYASNRKTYIWYRFRRK